MKTDYLIKSTVVALICCVTLYHANADNLNHRSSSIVANLNDRMLQQLVKQKQQQQRQQQHQQPHQQGQQFSEHDEGNEKENYLKFKRQQLQGELVQQLQQHEGELVQQLEGQRQRFQEQKVALVGPQLNGNAGQEQFPEVLSQQRHQQQPNQQHEQLQQQQDANEVDWPEGGWQKQQHQDFDPYAPRHLDPMQVMMLRWHQSKPESYGDWRDAEAKARPVQLIDEYNNDDNENDKNSNNNCDGSDENTGSGTGTGTGSDEYSKLFVQQVPRDWYYGNDKSTNNNGNGNGIGVNNNGDDVITGISIRSSTSDSDGGAGNNIDNYNVKGNKKRHNINKDDRNDNNSNNNSGENSNNGRDKSSENKYNNNGDDDNKNNNIYGFPISIHDSVTTFNNEYRNNDMDMDTDMDNNNENQNGDSIFSRTASNQAHNGGGGVDAGVWFGNGYVGAAAAPVQRHQDARNDFRSQFSIPNDRHGISTWRRPNPRGAAAFELPRNATVASAGGLPIVANVAVDNVANADAEIASDCNGNCNKRDAEEDLRQSSYDVIVVDNAADDDDDSLPYGIQNVRKRSAHIHGRGGRSSTLPNIYQSLCPTAKKLIPLETAGYEYRPNHYMEITCAPLGTSSSAPALGQRNNETVCSVVGFSCIQLHRSIHLIRRNKAAGSAECWESEIRQVPSGCECMWPKHNYGDIGPFHDRVHKRGQERPAAALLPWQHSLTPNLISITNGQPQLGGPAIDNIGFHRFSFN